MKLTEKKKDFETIDRILKEQRKKGESYATQSKPSKGLYQVWETLMLFFLIVCALAYFDLKKDTFDQSECQAH